MKPTRISRTDWLIVNHRNPSRIRLWTAQLGLWFRLGPSDVDEVYVYGPLLVGARQLVRDGNGKLVVDGRDVRRQIVGLSS